jgi:glycosyltransferase involved in cell wall biosynthesis
MTISVLILTLNEENNIAACLRSVGWASEVVVLDSLSTDRTADVAREMGARVVVRPFDTYAGQRNFGLAEIHYSTNWILMLDADERVPPDLRDEILAATRAASPNVALFAMRRRDFLWGKWIRRSGGYPTWFGRLARVGQVWVERPINEEYYSDGLTMRLAKHLHHFPFNKGLAAWIDKHNTYSTMEAELKLGRKSMKPSFRSLFSADGLRRRKVLKALVYTLPARPLFMFLALYFLRGGFIEGRAGLTFCVLRSWYEFTIDCKYRELVRRQRNLPI